VFGERPSARILLEASTEREWVARHLESLGHEVIVADPNYAPMYALRSRRDLRVPPESANGRLSSTSRIARTTENAATASPATTVGA